MKFRATMSGFMAAAVLAGAVATPLPAAAQSRHRQNTKNTWRNVAIGSGAVGLYGILKGDPAVALVGGAGALYSLNRYEHDRKSQSRADRARAAYYGRS